MVDEVEINTERSVSQGRGAQGVPWVFRTDAMNRPAAVSGQGPGTAFDAQAVRMSLFPVNRAQRSVRRRHEPVEPAPPHSTELCHRNRLRAWLAVFAGRHVEHCSCNSRIGQGNSAFRMRLNRCRPSPTGWRQGVQWLRDTMVSYVTFVECSIR